MFGGDGGPWQRSDHVIIAFYTQRHQRNPVAFPVPSPNELEGLSATKSSPEAQKMPICPTEDSCEHLMVSSTSASYILAYLESDPKAHTPGTIECGSGEERDTWFHELANGFPI